jgi:hypothetical protein
MSTIRAGTTTTTALQTTGDTTGNITLTADSGLVTADATGAMQIAKGTTAQRPSSPTTGQIRYNTSLSQYEAWDGTNWSAISFVNPIYAIDYLVVAGAGGGGSGGNSGNGRTLSSI